MANLRPMLLITVLVLGFLIWNQWQQDYNQKQAAQEPVPAVGQQATKIPESEDLPDPSSLDFATDKPVEPVAPVFNAESPRITITTDVLQVEIDLVGGSVVDASLLDYPEQLNTPDTKVQLLADTGSQYFIAQSGLLGPAQASPNHTTTFTSEQLEYSLSEGQDEIRVPLRWQGAGVQVTKTFIFRRGEYAADVRHYISNQSGASWNGSQYQQLQRTQPPTEGKAGFTNPSRYSYLGAAIYTPADKLEKLDFEDMASEPYEASTTNGWLAMIQHYFFAAWIPFGEENNQYSSKVINGTGVPRYLVRAVSAPVSVASGSQHEFRTRLFVGPKLQEQLEGIAPGLSLTVDYGVFTIFSKPLFWLLSNIHKFVINWGWSIVLLTVLIKLAFFKLTEAQYRSMAKMRKLQPRIEALKERFGDDKQRMSQAMMEMYKKEKVNPLGGCLPILVQIPIFIALYWVLLESVELRQAPFIGWIQNLSDRDPYFILPALNGIFMILTQRMTPTPGMDPMQRRIMSSLPIVFSVMFAFFPAGLVLYWATNAGLSLLQQWVITRKIAAQT